jgi:hypothetical protein
MESSQVVFFYRSLIHPPHPYPPRQTLRFVPFFKFVFGTSEKFPQKMPPAFFFCSSHDAFFPLPFKNGLS